MQRHIAPIRDRVYVLVWVELADFRGEETLVVFWNPGCGFCQQMLPDLKEWEARAPENSPRLLLVSAGSEAANR